MSSAYPGHAFVQMDARSDNEGDDERQMGAVGQVRDEEIEDGRHCSEAPGPRHPLARLVTCAAVGRRPSPPHAVHAGQGHECKKHLCKMVCIFILISFLNCRY